MTTLPQLSIIFRENRWRLIFTYTLILAENLARLYYPVVTGHAINTLLAGHYDGLVLFVVFWIARMGTGAWRRVYDTLTFTRIYADLATRVVKKQRSSSVPLSKIIARSALSKEFVDFFERDTPLIFRTAVAVVGSLAMLFGYDPLLGLAGLCLAPPLLVVNYFGAKRSLQLNHALNDQLEQEVEILSAEVAHSTKTVHDHYLKLAHWRVKLSNLEASNFSLMELFILTFFAVALVLTSRLPGAEAGTLFAVVTYVHNFIGGLDEVPTLVQQFSRLKDIGRRMYQEPTA
jgi:ABC-type multidrug transport system fused ATPase/permease subunit